LATPFFIHHPSVSLKDGRRQAQLSMRAAATKGW
jgi:hypothetical protein